MLFYIGAPGTPLSHTGSDDGRVVAWEDSMNRSAPGTPTGKGHEPFTRPSPRPRDPYSQPPGTPHPSVSQNYDPYCHMPGTPRPPPASSGQQHHFVKPQAPPSRDGDHFVRPQTPPRPVEGPNIPPPMGTPTDKLESPIVQEGRTPQSPVSKISDPLSQIRAEMPPIGPLGRPGEQFSQRTPMRPQVPGDARQMNPQFPTSVDQQRPDFFPRPGAGNFPFGPRPTTPTSQDTPLSPHAGMAKPAFPQRMPGPFTSRSDPYTQQPGTPVPSSSSGPPAFPRGPRPQQEMFGQHGGPHFRMPGSLGSRGPAPEVPPVSFL